MCIVVVWGYLGCFGCVFRDFEGEGGFVWEVWSCDYN